MKTIITLFFTLICLNLLAQNVSINIDGTDPNASAILDVQSTSKGFAPPRMNQYEMLNITNPANGLITFNTTNDCLYYFNGTNWTDFQFCDCGHAVDVEGNFYRAVKIGEQCWMAENLKTTKYSDGTSISGVYDNGATYLADYGKVYTWAAVMNGATSSNTNPSGVQGVCPDGWHVPSEAEWQELKTELNDATNDGRMLKKNDILWSSDSRPGYNDENQTGFDGLPAGYRSTSTSTFYNITTSALFWTSTFSGASDAICCGLTRNVATMNIGNMTATNAISVRCVRD